MKLIDMLNKKEMVEFLGKCWMSHDGVWFMNCAMELGMDAANRLNKAAIRSLAPIEIDRFRKGLGMAGGPLKNYRQVQGFFQGVGEVAIPDFMGARLAFSDKEDIRWGFDNRGCFAWRGMTRMKVIGEYECGVLYRIRCWLDALGVDYEMTPEVNGVCIDPEQGGCSGVFCLRF